MASSTPNPKMAHVNLMVDTVIFNLPEEGLRSVVRLMLATDPSITTVFEDRTRDYLRKTANAPPTQFFLDGQPLPSLHSTQRRIRSMLGCGMCYESIPLFNIIIAQASSLPASETSSRDLGDVLSTIDGDIIQAITAVEKRLLTSSGTRPFTSEEQHVLQTLLDSLEKCKKTSSDFPFERSLIALCSLLSTQSESMEPTIKRITIPELPSNIETFSLNGRRLPRLFSGLWQLSSPSWGTSSLPQIQSHLTQTALSGFTAYDMADHYGDAELLYGTFRTTLTNPTALFTATKLCIFDPNPTLTPQTLHSHITTRCTRTRSSHIDLLQLHWQNYSNPAYLPTLQSLSTDPRILALGLCNFSTAPLRAILAHDIPIATNQVQFSLIDARPTVHMGPLCTAHKVKLLTYGTLCGGLLSEKYLHHPDPFASDGGLATPSQRKYYEMILNWGGWELFQDLLVVLEGIAEKYSVSISNVATRWVLDFDFVGAVIVGTRWGVPGGGHTEENLRCYGWRLDGEDRAGIEGVLGRSRRDEMVGMLGDCGGEYR